MKKLLLLLFIVFYLTKANAQKVMFRPEASLGVVLDNHKWAFSQNYGASILISANKEQSYGIRSSYFTYKVNGVVKQYVNIGIVLEMTLFKYFNMGIGTLGFIDVTPAKNSAFGIYSHLGFQYPMTKKLFLLVAYQSDLLFRNQIAANSALTTGIGIRF